jgi:site-specific recombinase XerD
MIPVYPEMREIEPNACKGGIPYYTFMSDEATQALRLYLKEREGRHGAIDGPEPLFCSEYNQISREVRRTKTLTSREVQIVVKSTARRAGIAD